MKRLTLDSFKAKNLDKSHTQQVDLLLGQVLGDCHTDSSASDEGNNGPGVGETAVESAQVATAIITAALFH